MPKVTCYRVKDWDTHYENNRTKTMIDMRWVPFKNNHDGEGYCQMVEGDMGAAVLGAFVACVQVASRCMPRGTLLRKGGEPHTAISLASRTRLPLIAFEEMLKRATKPSIQWLEVIEIEVDTIINEIAAVYPHATRSLPAGNPQATDYGRKEGMEGKGREGTDAAPAFSQKDILLVLEGYPLKQGLRGAHYQVQQALMTLKERGEDNPTAKLQAILRQYSQSDVVKKGKAYSARRFFEEGHYDDDPAAWNDRKNGNGDAFDEYRPATFRTGPLTEDELRDMNAPETEIEKKMRVIQEKRKCLTLNKKT